MVREIGRINQAELDIAINNPTASWHQQYNDSAYIFIGGLPYDLTEGDVITIFSQYGEVVDVNLPRANPNPSEKVDGAASSSSQQQQQSKPVGKGKHRGFGFLMYEDQRSTVLAVDNLNGAQVLGRTLRVDHVASYKQPKATDEEGNRVDAEVKSFNAAPPEMGLGGREADDDNDDALEDPMSSYFQQRKREEKGKSKHGDDLDEHEREEKRRRKEERARIRAEREERRKHSKSHTSSSDRHRRSSTHRDDDMDYDRDRKRHVSHRHRDDRDDEIEDEGVNRYEQMKKPRSVLDADGLERHTSSRPYSRSRSRSRTPPRSSRHRSEHSSRGDHRRRDVDEHSRRDSRPSSSSHYRSSNGRRRSRSPAL